MTPIYEKLVSIEPGTLISLHEGSAAVAPTTGRLIDVTPSAVTVSFAGSARAVLQLDDVDRVTVHAVDEDLASLLTELAPHVLVVGSYAHGAEHADSDLDLWPLVTWSETDGKEVSALPLILELFERRGIDWSAPAPGDVTAVIAGLAFDVSEQFIVALNRNGDGRADLAVLDLWNVRVRGVEMRATHTDRDEFSGRRCNG